MIRSFDLRDFPTLHRNRNEGIWLDTPLALTRSMTLVPAGALLSTLAPATGIFTFVATNEGNTAQRVVGQFMHTPGAANAKLTFITPEDEIGSHDVPALLDHLADRAGERGAFNLLAEVDERSAAYEVLRRAGYAIYTRQWVWKLDSRETPTSQPWRPAEDQDETHVHHLYHTLVPAIVQQTEPPPWEKVSGLTYIQNGELLGYIHLAFGSKGVFAQPFIHQDVETVEDLLLGIYHAIPNLRSRDVYLCVRSHQAWLAPFLNKLGYNSAPRQAVMVKRLVKTQKITIPIHIPKGMDAIQPEMPSTGFTSSMTEPVLYHHDQTKNH